MGTMFSKEQLQKLIFPLIVEQVLAITVGMVDTMMISYAGESAISGVSLVDMINVLLINIFAAVATGGAVVVSQYLGHGNRKNACRAAEQLITVSVVISTGLMLVSLLFRGQILRLLFGAVEADVMENAMIYFLISAFSFPFLGVFNAGAATYRSMGNSRISMQVSAGMNVFNAIGNAILIFGFQMGTAGAALSTLAARVLGAVVMMILTMNRKNDVYVIFGNLFSWERDMVQRILHIAIPNGVENGLFQLGRVLVVSIISQFGTVQIAANAVANNLDSMGCIAGQAMNLAMITVVGQCMGAGEKDQAVWYTKKLWKFTYRITAIVNSIILLSLPFILNIYSLSPEARRFAFILVWIHDGCAILLWPTSFTMPNALRASGDVKFAMIVSVASMFIFRIGFSVILGIHLGLGAIGVWIAMVFDWLCRVSFYTWRFLSRKWLNFKVI
ncbi:MATE family efflux transporter [bacterium 1XD8-76]|nr:MATE family efflux transporter [bacterium 1XD8-76]